MNSPVSVTVQDGTNLVTVVESCVVNAFAYPAQGVSAVKLVWTFTKWMQIVTI